MGLLLSPADVAAGIARTADDAAAAGTHERLAIADIVSWVEAAGARQTGELYRAAAELLSGRSASPEARRWVLRLAELVGGAPVLPTQGRAQERYALR